MLKNKLNETTDSIQAQQNTAILPAPPPFIRQFKVSHTPEFLAQQREFCVIQELQRLLMFNQTQKAKLNTGNTCFVETKNENKRIKHT